MSTPEVQKDKVNIRTSKNGDDTSNLLLSKGWFSENIEVFRTALAYGLANKLKPSEEVGPGGRNWNVGTLDQDGSVKILMEIHGYVERPYAIAEAVVETALIEIGKRLRNGESLGQIFLN